MENIYIHWKEADSMKIITSVVVKIVPYICASILNQHQFMELLKEIEDNDGVYFGKTYWLGESFIKIHHIVNSNSRFSWKEKKSLVKYSTMKSNLKMALCFTFSHQYQMNINMLNAKGDYIFSCCWRSLLPRETSMTIYDEISTFHTIAKILHNFLTRMNKKKFQF